MSSSQQSHQLDLLSVTPQEKTPSTSESEQVDDTCTASSNNRSRGNSTANNEDNRLLSIPISNKSSAKSPKQNLPAVQDQMMGSAKVRSASASLDNSRAKSSSMTMYNVTETISEKLPKGEKHKKMVYEIEFEFREKEIKMDLHEEKEVDDSGANNLVDFNQLNKELEESLEYHLVHSGLDKVNFEKIAADDLKQICRNGLMHSYRRKVWLLVTRASEFFEKDMKLYKETYEDVFTHCNIEDIPLIPTFGHSYNFDYHYLTADGIKALHRTLVLIQRVHFDLDFCPLIADLAAISLGYMPEEESFCMLHSLIKRSRKDSWYLPLSARHFAICTETIRLLVQDKLSSLYNHIEKIGALDGTLGIFKDWFGRGFIAQLPRYTLLRILDTFLNEGMKIFYRVGLGILKVHQDELLQQKHPKAFLQTLGHLSRNYHDGQELLTASFAISMSRKDITKLQSSANSKIKTTDIPSKKRVLIEWPKFDPMDSKVFTRRDIYTLWTWIPSQLHVSNLRKIFTSSEHGFSLNSFIENVQKKGPVIIGIRTVPISETKAKKSIQRKSSSRDPPKKDPSHITESSKASAAISGNYSDTDTNPPESRLSRRKSFKKIHSKKNLLSDDVFGIFISDDMICNGKPIVDRLLFLFQKLSSGELVQYKWIEDAKDNEVMYLASNRYIAFSGSGRAAIYFGSSGLDQGSSNPTDAYRSPSFARQADGQFEVSVVEVWAFEDL